MPYELNTPEQIMTYMTNEIRQNYPGIDMTRDSSPVWLMLSAFAIEIYELYRAANENFRQGFADTADLEYLIRRAEERGIIRRSASKSVMRARFWPETIDVAGERFSRLGIIFEAATLEGTGVDESNGRTYSQYQVVCEQDGTIGNVTTGQIIPVNHISGLERSEIVELLIPGEDDESVDSLRNRYFRSLSAEAFGGNIADYKEKIEAIQGVGGVKVYRTPQGGGTVGCTIIASDWTVPSSTLVDLVQTTVDPIPNNGEGLGTAPIGHYVTVIGCSSTTVNVGLHLTFSDGYDWGNMEAPVTAELDAYFLELSQQWADELTTVVRTSQIEARLVNMTGILDIDNTTLNGDAANLELPSDNIPVRGTVTNA